MELDGIKGEIAVRDALDRSIVKIAKCDLPLREKCGRINCIAMILGGDVAPIAFKLKTGLVLAAMAKGKFVGLGARSARHELHPQTDAKNRLLSLHHLF